LLDSLFVVDFKKATLRTWPLILDSPPVDLAEDKLKKFPGPIEITAMYAPHLNFERGSTRP
jgi:hypothetical protein